MRIVTYNVRRCLGLDGVCSPQRIAEVVASCHADVIALQEVDRHQPRTGGVDQARIVAELIGAKHWRFVPSVRGT